MNIQTITKETFALYGTVLEFPAGFNESFYIVDTEEKSPWRIAVFRYSNKGIKVVEQHPASKESFEPLKGVTILLAAENESPEKYQAFLLDKPVCLAKGIWHQVLALTPEAEVKITENLEVETKFYEYEKEKTVIISNSL